MSTLDHEGVPLAYQIRGSGDPVVLIHGLGCRGADWILQVAALESRFRLILPDLPGSGASPPLRGTPTIQGYASAFWGLLDTLNIPVAHLVGFSLGGAVALEMALQCPARVPRLALINSLASYQDHWRKWAFARSAEALIRLVGMRRAARIWATDLFPDPWQRALRDRAASAVAAVPARTYLAMARALERWSATEPLDRLSSRTLVIAAEHDHAPLEEKRALATRLGASLLMVRGSRHATPFDATQATNAGLLMLLSNETLPPYFELECDTPALTRALSAAHGISIEEGLCEVRPSESTLEPAQQIDQPVRENDRDHRRDEARGRIRELLRVVRSKMIVENDPIPEVSSSAPCVTQSEEK